MKALQPWTGLEVVMSVLVISVFVIVFIIANKCVDKDDTHTVWTKDNNKW